MQHVAAVRMGGVTALWCMGLCCGAALLYLSDVAWLRHGRREIMNRSRLDARLAWNYVG